MFTCCIRYELSPDRLVDFKEYARAWIALIEKYGGTHHGYFVPGEGAETMPSAAFSFPGLGRVGPPNVAFALFSFRDVETYEAYRKDVSEDPGCLEATRRFREAPSFLSYERTFLVPIFE